jgi:uncharacterized protein with von Willebrand factor type A (vWA) domain
MLSGNQLPESADWAGALRTRLAGFSGFLQADGYDLGAAESTRVLAAANQVGILDPQLLRWSLKALLCSRPGEWHRFDALFDAYFLPANSNAFHPARSATVSDPRPLLESNPEPRRGRSGAGAPPLAPASARHGASRDAALAARDFRDLDRAEEMRAIEALMRRLARRMKRLRTRREARSRRRGRIDFPGTIRRSVEHGGVPLAVAWRDRRRVRPRIVLLLDVSRSMTPYSFLYLRLARALAAELSDIDVYVFHTRLTPICEALRDPDPWRAQEKLHLLSAGWDGGTRIGECLREFNRACLPHRVHKRTAVIIVSDGYDTGAPEILAAALRTLRRHARRIVWINPLMIRAGWSPVSRAMQAALPHLDLLAPGADLASLQRSLPDIMASLQ